MRLINVIQNDEVKVDISRAKRMETRMSKEIEVGYVSHGGKGTRKCQYCMIAYLVCHSGIDRPRLGCNITGRPRFRDDNDVCDFYTPLPSVANKGGNKE